MAKAVDIRQKPEADEIYMIAGWRQWADAGSVSSGLPQFLIQQTGARQIGAIRPDGFYLFQFPGTHDLVRPVVKFTQGYPESLTSPQNDLYYTRIGRTGLVIFLGDEPHMDIERYVSAFLDAAEQLNVRRIVGFGGVYGEMPYDKERMVSAIYSKPGMKEEMGAYAVTLSDYHGGASIESYIARRAGERGMEFVGFYAFVPAYDFSELLQTTSSIRIENDFSAWLSVMRRVNYMLKVGIDLTELEKMSASLLEMMDSKIEEIEVAAPDINIREYIRRISEEFHETEFSPLEDVWEEELKRLMDKYDGETGSPSS